MSAHLIAEWREAMQYLLAVLAGGPKAAHRNEDSEFARDAKGRRHDASIAARDATLAMVDAVRAARADVVSVRELAAWLGKGDLLELDDLLGLWRRVVAIVDELEAREPVTRNRPARQSTDSLAAALVDAWSDPDSPSYRPAGFNHNDVAEALGKTPQALTGKQRDKVTLRCPKYMRRMRERRTRK